MIEGEDGIGVVAGKERGMQDGREGKRKDGGQKNLEMMKKSEQTKEGWKEKGNKGWREERVEGGVPSSSVFCPDQSLIVMLDDQFNHDIACCSSPRSSKHLFHQSLPLSLSMLACSCTSLFSSSTLDVSVDFLSGLV